jgi:hypothetical protein
MLLNTFLILKNLLVVIKNLKNMQIHIAQKDLKGIHELTDDAIDNLIKEKSD